MSNFTLRINNLKFFHCEATIPTLVQESIREREEAELIENEGDACEICDGDLYYNEKYTKRVGMLDSGNKVCGWMCPHCSSEFDTDNHLTKFLGEDGVRGEA